MAHLADLLSPSLTKLFWVLGAIGLVAIIRVMSRCSHPGPLGLLPPHKESDGTQIGARWYCPQCEAEWPAVFEHDHQPIQRFSGYDPAKPIAAARRARELEAHQRRLAIARAGLAAERRTRVVDDVPRYDNVLNLPPRGARRPAAAKSASFS